MCREECSVRREERQVRKKKGIWGKGIYAVIMFGLCLFPLVGIWTAGVGTHNGKEILTDFPKLREADSGYNMDWLSDAGAWFEEHFAFRDALVTANAVLNTAVFQVSSDDGVIAGTDGWLYYADTLENYLGESVLTERELYNIAHSLALMQEYAQKCGCQFLFVPVPNKNTVCGSHMPYYDRYKVSEERDLQRLIPYLEQEGVRYLNLLQLFLPEQNGPIGLYHRTDSHWTNRGAALTAEAICASFEKEPDRWTLKPYEIREDFTGDLANMLYPSWTRTEEELYYQDEFPYVYEGNVKSTYDPKITTRNPEQEGSIVVYRDSFGNALLPFLADAWGAGYFSRVENFPLQDILRCGADALVVERVERFLPNLAKHAAVMEAPIRHVSSDRVRCVGTCEATQAAQFQGYVEVGGTLDSETPDFEGLDDETILVSMDGQTFYEAFPVTVEEDGIRNPYGFYALVPEEYAENSAMIYVEDKNPCE